LTKTPQHNIRIISLGCPKNQIDAEVMAGLLTRAGHRLVLENDDADVMIVNTCSFIGPAKEEAIEVILTLAEEKKDRPHLRLIVAGCLSQRYGRDLLTHLPEVDLFVGTGEVGNIVEHIHRATQRPRKRTAVITKPSFIMTADYARILPLNATSAYLKISEGCSNRCSYCVIPVLRGKARSRQPEDILREAESLVQRGIKEIIVVAQDTTNYGKDLKGRPRLSTVLKDMAKIKNLRWIRLLYAHPAHIATDLLETIASHEKICRYLDLPVQHIDDDILKAMNRKINGAKIRSVISHIRRVIPNVTLRTSLIVGFPGETPTRFNRLLEFVNEVKFDHLGVFNYSREEGTKAAALKSQISEKEKERRRELIMTEQAAISAAINQNLVGSTQEVLIEGKSDRPDYDYWGRSPRQAPEIDGVTYVKAPEARVGDFIKCAITAAATYDLFGEIVH